MRYRKNLMIIVFGYISMELKMELDTKLTFPCAIKSNNAQMNIGGSAANQAIAAARCGAKTSLIGTIGNDIFGKNILSALRRDGIHSSGIAKKELPTSIINSIFDKNGEKASIIMEGANTDICAEQIPDNLLNEKTLLLLQNDIALEINKDIAKRAKSGGARNIICIEHEQNIDDKLLNYADFIIVNDKILPPKNTNAILVEHKNRAFDAFCGSFSACWQAGLSIERAKQYGHSAAKLAAKNNALPYLCDVEDDIKHR